MRWCTQKRRLGFSTIWLDWDSRSPARIKRPPKSSSVSLVVPESGLPTQKLEAKTLANAPALAPGEIPPKVRPRICRAPTLVAFGQATPTQDFTSCTSERRPRGNPS